jgi:integrase
VWVNTPDGSRKRKYVYGESRDVVHETWVKLHAEAHRNIVPTSTPTLAKFLDGWLASSVRPNLAPSSVSSYETVVRWYIVPFLGSKKLAKLTVADMRSWLAQLKETCQCCAQGKDARRKEARCCAIDQCCGQTLSARSVRDARTILRSALNVAMVDALITKNPAALVRMPTGVRRVNEARSVAEAHQLLTSARDEGDSLYAAYVLILALGLRKGEALGVTFD